VQLSKLGKRRRAMTTPTPTTVRATRALDVGGNGGGGGDGGGGVSGETCVETAMRLRRLVAAPFLASRGAAATAVPVLYDGTFTRFVDAATPLLFARVPPAADGTFHDAVPPVVAAAAATDAVKRAPPQRPHDKSTDADTAFSPFLVVALVVATALCAMCAHVWHDRRGGVRRRCDPLCDSCFGARRARFDTNERAYNVEDEHFDDVYFDDISDDGVVADRNVIHI
jgi:hypothetical protein